MSRVVRSSEATIVVEQQDRSISHGPFDFHPVDQQPLISRTSTVKSPPARHVDSTFPDAVPDLFADWGTNWSFDWISSNIQFSGSEIPDINTIGQAGHCEGIPLQEKIDFFEGLEKVGIEDTAPPPTHDSTLHPPPTIQTSSPVYGTGLEITSSVAKELDIAGNLLRFRNICYLSVY